VSIPRELGGVEREIEAITIRVRVYERENEALMKGWWDTAVPCGDER
jgi:hypothetical protein